MKLRMIAITLAATLLVACGGETKTKKYYIERPEEPAPVLKTEVELVNEALAETDLGITCTAETVTLPENTEDLTPEQGACVLAFHYGEPLKSQQKLMGSLGGAKAYMAFIKKGEPQSYNNSVGKIFNDLKGHASGRPFYARGGTEGNFLDRGGEGFKYFDVAMEVVMRTSYLNKDDQKKYMIADLSTYAREEAEEMLRENVNLWTFPNQHSGIGCLNRPDNTTKVLVLNGGYHTNLNGIFNQRVPYGSNEDTYCYLRVYPVSGIMNETSSGGVVADYTFLRKPYTAQQRSGYSTSTVNPELIDDAFEDAKKMLDAGKDVLVYGMYENAFMAFQKFRAYLEANPEHKGSIRFVGINGAFDYLSIDGQGTPAHAYPDAKFFTESIPKYKNDVLLNEILPQTIVNQKLLFD